MYYINTPVTAIYVGLSTVAYLEFGKEGYGEGVQREPIIGEWGWHPSGILPLIKGVGVLKA